MEQSVLKLMSEFQTDIWKSVFSDNGFLIYSIILAIGMVISYVKKDTKIPFFQKQLECFSEVHKYLALAFGSLYLVLTYGSFLNSLSQNQLTLFQVMIDGFNKYTIGGSLLVSCVLVNYCILKFDPIKFAQRSGMVIGFLMVSDSLSFWFNNNPYSYISKCFLLENGSLNLFYVVSGVECLLLTAIIIVVFVIFSTEKINHRIA